MESGRLFFDRSACQGNMRFFGEGASIFRGSGTMMMSMEEGSRRRPFFSSPDELIDEEYYDEQFPDKKRRLNSDQVHMLEKSFEEDNRLEPRGRPSWPTSWGCSPGRLLCGFRTVVLGGRPSSLRGTMISSNHLTNPFFSNTTPWSSRLISINLR